MNRKAFRPAIAMIELIFAIVIIGIILMTAPMLISTAAKSGYVAIQQEAINEAASQVNMVMGYHWDENNTDESFLDPIVQVSSAGDIELKEANVSGFLTGHRLGTPRESKRGFIRSDSNRTSASTIGIDTGESGNYDEDDIDDFDGDTSLKEIDPAGLVDYVEDNTTIRINTKVRYITHSVNYNSGTISFSPDFDPTNGTTSSASSTNIKRITVTLTNVGAPAELNKNIILHAFSCNIGGYKLEEKSF